MSKPILIITVPGPLSDERHQELSAQLADAKIKQDYHVIGVNENSCSPRDRVQFRLMNAGFWERLFDYLTDRRRRQHAQEVDELRNKLHYKQEMIERLVHERDELKRSLDKVNGIPGVVFDNPTAPIIEAYCKGDLDALHISCPLRVAHHDQRQTIVRLHVQDPAGREPDYSQVISFTTRPNHTR